MDERRKKTRNTRGPTWRFRSSIVHGRCLRELEIRSLSSCSSICIRPINLCKEKHCRTNAPAQAVCLRVRSVWRGEHASSTGKIRRSGISKSNDSADTNNRREDRSLRDHANRPEIRDEFPRAPELLSPPLSVPRLSSPTFLNLYRQIFSRKVAGANLPDERKTRKLGNAAGVSAAVRTK